MSLATKPLHPIGVEIVGVDIDALLHDPQIPARVLELLDANGVLVFRRLGLDDAQQVAFARRLGEIVVKGPGAAGRGGDFPEIFKVSFDPKVNSAIYLKATIHWHIDGTTDEIPSKASLLSGRVLPAEGGDTQFASTYAAYDRLSDSEKTRFEGMKVCHTVETSYRLIDPNPPPEVLEILRQQTTRLHPLVWTHRNGRKSLVLGATTSHVEGMPEREGAALLRDLLARATESDRVYTHRWQVGDLVIWDNRGVLHRAQPYAADSGREMHRVTLVGDEPIA